MSSSRVSSRAEAKALVEQITDDHGYLGEEVLKALPPEIKQRVIHAMSKKDQMIGSSAITLAKNLYTSSARFVFELLQNADDNHYSTAYARGVDPYVSFTMSPSRIIIECNEDGFSEENLKAICNIGKSSKTGAQGYIGEKGIGFKSVFMAAYKVRIQSGNFSFYFQHRRNDSGMGMISPTWEEPDQQVKPGVTRIALDLHDTGHEADLAELRETISKQFQDIEATHLLFLKNLKRIDINHANEKLETTSSTTYTVHSSNSGTRRTQLRKMCDNGTMHDTYYHVTKHVATSLARNENREYSVLEETNKAYSTAEVVLAFPMTEESVPITEAQNIFAFLPIRNMGFKFLIQTDFVTQANRQDIVTTSARNVGLLGGIAEAFVKAMRQMCDHDTLQYRWMRYLPQHDDFPWDGYWSKLVDQIKGNLASASVLRPLSQGQLQLIGQMRRHSEQSTYHNGEAIFEDINPERYLSKHYVASDLAKLTEYRLVVITMSEILDRAMADLGSPNSRMKSLATNEEWHSAAASSLIYTFTEDGRRLRPCHRHRVSKMPLIPTQRGGWISADDSSVPIAFPTVEGVVIPTDLDLQLIQQSAVQNPERRLLFAKLGAIELSVRQVRQIIFEIYSKSSNLALLFGNSLYPEKASLAHLSFLYLTHNRQHDEKQAYSSISVITMGGSLKMPHSADVYIAHNHRYGAKRLLGQVASIPGESKGAPGFQVPFLVPAYLESPLNSTEPLVGIGSWRKWLRSELGICNHPRLTWDGSLTSVCRYVMEHRPEEFLGLLQFHWASIQQDVMASDSIRDEIAKTKVPCGNGEFEKLSNTYLPISDLEERCEEYQIADDFPFLSFDDTLCPDDLSAWDFLHTAFGVGKHDDLGFYLEMLEHVARRDSELVELNLAEQLVDQDEVNDLYKMIYSMSQVRTGRETHQETIRAKFEKGSLLLLPSKDLHTSAWVSPSSCRWDASPLMTTARPVEFVFQDFLGETQPGRGILTEFLKTTLDIKNCTCGDLIDELKALRLSIKYERERAKAVYQDLARLAPKLSKEGKARIKNEFWFNDYICAPDGWRKVPDCLWSSATQIQGKTILNNMYQDLKVFMVDFLGVPTLTLEMVYKELIRLGATQATEIPSMKQAIWEFNSLLASSSPTEKLPDPVPVQKAFVFPVKRNGNSSLCTFQEEFAVNDRQHYWEAFADSAKFLDFSLDEVRRLQPTLTWAGLDSRRVSSCVSEKSTLLGHSGTAISCPRRDLKTKAYALSRIAKHFNSPRIDGDPKILYETLRSTIVLETDGIASELQLLQDEKTLRVRQSQSELHIEEKQGHLIVYVPRDIARQESCYLDVLPQRMFEWIMMGSAPKLPTQHSEQAVRVLGSVLNASVQVVSTSLRNNGVTELDFLEEPPEEINEDKAPELAVVLRPSTPTADSDQAHGVVTPGELGSDDTDSSAVETPASSVFSEGSPRTHRLIQAAVYSSSRLGRGASAPQEARPVQYPFFSPSPQPSPSPNSDLNGQGPASKYLKLLDAVLTAARSATLPRRDSFDMSTLMNALPQVTATTDAPQDYFHFRSTSQFERDRMIGAAGELFVFELLSHLDPNLPGFSRENWQSTIRRYVTVHPDYADMPPWIGRETADITYHDIEGKLTDLLIDSGCLASVIWRGRRPKYFIEVKSTTMGSETPFFMSKSQYRRMRNMSNGRLGEENPDTVYVVFRVSKVGSREMALNVYVDPDVMQQNGELEFAAEQWSVVPGVRPDIWNGAR
ncbi:uncharacterized protein BCR38DRAFT_521547 [Pseudomassariella vexata]|uniref:Protein NO VEIN C-terminal domain-containing protein n=1 Tax=Pseudomassariella vexata TaxID=1141098 RepID=A0A1Y2EA73_9PEZI|nr:uncharacterized protein BCR38DRAFT_521547 [Pseudomassariella vexata]ORY68490.1 hypothetical protein BCR38DRAFT_521547 [Pseudomassariella vexata]